MGPPCARGSAAVLSVHPHRPLLLGHRGCISARGDLGIGLEHRRRLCRAGIGRPQHVLRRRSLHAVAVLSSVGPATGRGRSRRDSRQSRSCTRGRHADVSLAGPLFQHGDDRGRRIDPHLRRHVGSRRRRDRPARTGGRARPVGPPLPPCAAELTLLSGRADPDRTTPPSRPTLPLSSPSSSPPTASSPPPPPPPPPS